MTIRQQIERGLNIDFESKVAAYSTIANPLRLDTLSIFANTVVRWDAKNLTIQADPNSVYIRGKSEQKKEERKGSAIRYSELSATEVYRRIALPSSINPEKITARLANGMLELTLPNASPPKTIEIKAA